ncbi:hypothetical protein DKX38_014819 [Salix brachista]|uniref:CCHC-type domain-containing protein n=1 Tax=Salix brachista TaxID=2182728 RepID=A0A5N5LG95_9ROSI|nr:hypothetical protein DKX38_014819 [Salix brachista]
MDVASRRDVGMNSHAMQVQRNLMPPTSYKQPYKATSRKTLKCTNCDGEGHLVDRCYYIIGFPEGHKWHGKNVKPRNKRSAAHNVETSNSATDAKSNACEGPMFTTEEYNQIMTILRNGNGQPLANATDHVTMPTHPTIQSPADSLDHTIPDFDPHHTDSQHTPPINQNPLTNPLPEPSSPTSTPPPEPDRPASPIVPDHLPTRQSTRSTQPPAHFKDYVAHHSTLLTATTTSSPSMSSTRYPLHRK